MNQTNALLMKIIHTCIELWVSYDGQVTAMKLFPEVFHVLVS